MPNHYTNVLTIYPSGDREDFMPKLEAWWNGALMRLRPRPETLTGYSVLEWGYANWGTKWDLYDGDVLPLHGDCGPILVTFCTAWAPPNVSMRTMLVAELLALGADNVLWVGMDPKNTTQHILWR